LSDGFTATRIGTGHYKIAFDQEGLDDYVIVATALTQTMPYFVTVKRSPGFVEVFTWNLGGNLIDTPFHFVVYSR